MKKQDDMYLVFCILYVVLAIAYIVYQLLLKESIVIPGCWFFQTFGVYCPACGGTRATLALLQGNILQSLYYNPIVVVVAFVTLLYMLVYTIGILLKKDKLKIQFHRGYGYLFVIVLIVNCVIRNYMLLQFHIKI